MTFYSAVHYVEAYFFGQGKHYQLHQARESAIKRDSKIKGIFRNYERLKTASIYARYEADFFTDKQYGGLQPNLDAIKKVIRPLI